MESFLQEFREECADLFLRLEASLLEAEKECTDELINEIYRHLHTIKGGAGMFNFSSMESLAHELESLITEVQAGTRTLDSGLITIILQSIDTFKQILEGTAGEKEVEQQSKALNEFSTRKAADPSGTSTSRYRCYSILLQPEATIFKRGLNFGAVLEELKGLGKCQLIVHNEGIPLQQQLDKKEISSRFEILFQTEFSEREINDVLLFLKENEKCVIPVTTCHFYSDQYRSWISLTDEEIALRENIFADFLQQPLTPVSKSEEVSTPAEKSSSKRSAFINVATAKLDHLINVVSELVIFRSELQHLLGEKQNQALAEATEKLDRLTLSLRDSAFAIRLVPLNTLSVKLQRLVRTLSEDLHKDVEFIMEGLNTELDRSIINSLEAPLMHLIRNAIDHGIETPDERVSQNKPRRGLLKLFSYNSGDHVFIQLQDDGRGINFEKIRERGIKSGILAKDHEYTEKELLHVMMMPGFSTAEKLSAVSGRGVGLDVVKKEITSLRGDIEISTEHKLGSIFTIRLPLTLTILDTLVVNVAENKYLLPISEIEHCFKISHEQLFHKPIRQINYRGQLLPFVSLREQFHHDSHPEEYTMIIIQKNDRKLGIAVDEIAGSLQTVYKPLNELFQSVECFSGASILGDGTMAFIIDPLKLSA
jgi:two-component system, chemotaxis family, sensor kinase CheA